MLLRQARELGVEVIDTEHLLLGLLAHDEETVAKGALTELNINADALRQALRDRVAR